jgi:multicomponent Na+:H+ antiporter subunit G
VISAIGLLRLPDFYIRISAITKAISLGITMILLGIGIYFNNLIVGGKVILIILFMFLTSPVAAHIIAHAAIKKKVPFWGKTLLDEFRPYMKKKEEEEES